MMKETRRESMMSKANAIVVLGFFMNLGIKEDEAAAFVRERLA